MVHFSDLSTYSLLGRVSVPNALNVGWLSKEVEFEKAETSFEDLRALFNASTVSIGQTRGFHACEFCDGESWPIIETMEGISLKLGSAEIRIFGPDGRLYAAPNLLYHYVKQHRYKLPEEVSSALKTKANIPPAFEYFSRLATLDLDWSPTIGTMMLVPGQRRRLLEAGVEIGFDGTVYWGDGKSISPKRDD